MTRAAQIERVRGLAQLRFVGPRVVGEALGIQRTAAIAKIRQLGGEKVPGIGWRLSERALVEYLRDLHARERGRCHHVAQDSTDYQSTTATDAGSATSEPTPASESSALSTSETMEPPQASAQQSPPTGKSKHALRLAKMFESVDRRKRSAKPSKL